jgi:hypothetical protein
MPKLSWTVLPGWAGLDSGRRRVAKARRITLGSCALQGLDKRVLGRRDAGVFVRAVRHYGLQVRQLRCCA